MKTPLVLAILLLLELAVQLHASTGTISEVVMPATSGSLNSQMAANDEYLLVPAHYASYKATTSGPVLNAAGEVLVFNAATRKLIRRLRPAVPVQGANFGSRVALHGNRAFISDSQFTIHAFEVSSGKRLWQFNTSTVVDNNRTIKGYNIYSLAADGDDVLVGMAESWYLHGPQYGMFMLQGSVARLSAITGKQINVYSAFPGEPLKVFTAAPGEQGSLFGSSVAMHKQWLACSSPKRDTHGLTDNGNVVVYPRGAGNPVEITEPNASSGNWFGYALAFSNSHLLVGAPFSSASGKAAAGAVYMYELNTLTHVRTILPPSSLQAGAKFGTTLTACGSRVLIGAAVGGNEGAAFLYDTGSSELSVLNPQIAGATSYNLPAIALNHTQAFIKDAFLGGPWRTLCFSPLGRKLTGVKLIAATGQSAPGGQLGMYFSKLGDAALSSAGKVAHLATVKGGGATSATDGGLWSDLDGTHSLLLREGDLLLSRKLSAPTKPFFAENGQGRFLARFAGNQAQNLYIDNGTQVYSTLGETSTFLVSGMQESVKRLNEIVESPAALAGELFSYTSTTGGAGVHAGNDSHLGRRSGLAIIDEAREGNASPIAGLAYGQMPVRLAANGGQLAFVAPLAGAPSSSNSALL